MTEAVTTTLPLVVAVIALVALALGLAQAVGEYLDGLERDAQSRALRGDHEAKIANARAEREAIRRAGAHRFQQEDHDAT